MLFSIKNSHGFKTSADLVIYSFFEDESIEDTFLAHDIVAKLVKEQKITGKAKEVTSIYLMNDENKLTKVLFMGLGKRESNLIEDSISQTMTQIENEKVKAISWNLLDKAKDEAQIETLSEKVVYDFYETIYQFNQYKTDDKDSAIDPKIELTIEDTKYLKLASDKVTTIELVAKAIKEAKDLANQPPNVCNARYLADKGIELTNDCNSLTATIYGEKELAELKMSSYLAVGRGSKNESIMTVLEYKGAKTANEKPIVLVGKGLTFDSGGISLKPGAGMEEMKYDMCGAATVYGVIKAISDLKLNINVIGVMAGCENMPDADSYRPGDILTSMSGKTIEVVNTDAEGRLVLCDVLTFVDRFSPKYVIDIATLTGACIVALGHHYTAVLGNDDLLINELLKASKESKDKAWQLPISDEFQKQIESTCADIQNSAGRDGGTITAACFLSKFTQKYQWAHLDIAGTAWKSGNKASATGRPIPLLVQFLMNQTA